VQSLQLSFGQHLPNSHRHAIQFELPFSAGATGGSLNGVMSTVRVVAASEARLLEGKVRSGERERLPALGYEIL